MKGILGHIPCSHLLNELAAVNPIRTEVRGGRKKLCFLLHLPMLSAPAAFNILRGCSCSLPARVGVIIVRSGFTNLFPFFRFIFYPQASSNPHFLCVPLGSSQPAKSTFIKDTLYPRLSRHLLTHNHLDGCCSNLTNNRKLQFSTARVSFLRPHRGGLSTKTTETATNATCHLLQLSLSQLLGREKQAHLFGEALLFT